MTKRLYRSRTNSMIGGICGGLGEYFNIDPTIFRLILLFTLFSAGVGIFPYLIALLVIPKEPETLIERM
ncbi:MAG: PspC domain-containing protein [Bacteroidales bacterium]|nr:PspC domain-containing protein [Bacteroidales bacterium]